MLDFKCVSWSWVRMYCILRCECFLQPMNFAAQRSCHPSFAKGKARHFATTHYIGRKNPVVFSLWWKATRRYKPFKLTWVCRQACNWELMASFCPFKLFHLEPWDRGRAMSFTQLSESAKKFADAARTSGVNFALVPRRLQLRACRCNFRISRGLSWGLKDGRRRKEGGTGAASPSLHFSDNYSSALSAADWALHEAISSSEITARIHVFFASAAEHGRGSGEKVHLTSKQARLLEKLSRDKH